MAFTKEEIQILQKSPYVKEVKPHRIEYGKPFYQEFWRVRSKGYTAEEALDFLGLSSEIVGKDRVKSIDKRARELYEEGILFKDEIEEKTSLVKQLDEHKREIKKLKQENEFLKKKKLIDWKYKI